MSELTSTKIKLHALRTASDDLIRNGGELVYLPPNELLALIDAAEAAHQLRHQMTTTYPDLDDQPHVHPAWHPLRQALTRFHFEQ